MSRSLVWQTLLLSLLFGAGFLIVHPAQAEDRTITFPVIGSVRHYDDFGAPRSGGRTHEGNDIIGVKGQLLVAAVDGTVWYVPFPQPSWGYAVVLVDEDGYEYWYIHMNNDTPGTDDGRGGGRDAYAPGMDRGLPVVAGQLVGYMGDSGNAEQTSPHLHFEIRRPGGEAIDPFVSLQQARRVSRPTVAPRLPGELLPYGEFQGGAAVASGEFNGDITDRELVTGAGPGGGSHVRIFDADDDVLAQFFAFHPNYRGGMDVAAGDVDGDGIDEVIVVPLTNAEPIVRVFTTAGVLRYEFFAYGRSFLGGLRVAAADLNGDGRAEIITGPRAGTAPLVRVFTPSGRRIREFNAYDPAFRGGIDVAATAATDEGEARIVTGAGPGGGPNVRVFSARGQPQASFFPYDRLFRGGVNISVGEIDDDNEGPEILTVPANGGGADFRMFNTDAEQLDRFTNFERWWRGGYDIAASGGFVYVASGPGGRRASVRRELDGGNNAQTQNLPDFFRRLGSRIPGD